MSVKTGGSKTPSYTVNPAEATNKKVSFKSDNNAVATVNETTGEVTGLKDGSLTRTTTGMSVLAAIRLTRQLTQMLTVMASATYVRTT